MKTEHGSAAGIPNPTVNAQARIAGPHKRQTEIIRDAYPAHGSLGFLLILVHPYAASGPPYILMAVQRREA